MILTNLTPFNRLQSNGTWIPTPLNITNQSVPALLIRLPPFSLITLVKLIENQCAQILSISMKKNRKCDLLTVLDSQILSLSMLTRRQTLIGIRWVTESVGKTSFCRERHTLLFDCRIGWSRICYEIYLIIKQLGYHSPSDW